MLLMKELLAKNYSQELENNFKHKINQTEQESLCIHSVNTTQNSSFLGEVCIRQKCLPKHYLCWVAISLSQPNNFMVRAFFQVLGNADSISNTLGTAVTQCHSLPVTQPTVGHVPMCSLSNTVAWFQCAVFKSPAVLWLTYSNNGNLFSSTGMLGYFTKKSELSFCLSGSLATLLVAAASHALVPNGLSRDAQSC